MINIFLLKTWLGKILPSPSAPGGAVPGSPSPVASPQPSCQAPWGLSSKPPPWKQPRPWAAVLLCGIWMRTLCPGPCLCICLNQPPLRGLINTIDDGVLHHWSNKQTGIKIKQNKAQVSKRFFSHLLNGLFFFQELWRGKNRMPKNLRWNPKFPTKNFLIRSSIKIGFQNYCSQQCWIFFGCVQLHILAQIGIWIHNPLSPGTNDHFNGFSMPKVHGKMGLIV